MFDASTLSQNRRRRYNDMTVAQDIFDAIVEQAIAKGLVDGTVLYTDSTHLKANANKNRYDMAVIAKSRTDYWDALDVAIGLDRAEHGKNPLPDKPRQPVEKETKVSRTDPDAGYMVRDGKPKKASSIAITAPWTASSASSPTPAPHPQMSTTPSSI